MADLPTSEDNSPAGVLARMAANRAWPSATQPTAGAHSPAATATSSVWPFALLMAFTVILLLSPQTSIAVLRPLHIALAAAGLSALTYVLGRARRHQSLLPMTRPTVLTLALLALAVATIPLAYWPGGSFGYLKGMFLQVLVIFWLLSNVVDTVPRLRTVAVVLSVLAVPLAFSAIRSYFSGAFDAEELSHGLDRINGYQGALTSNPNDLALMLNLILPLSMALFLFTRRTAWRVLLLAGMGLDVVAIVATYSRGGFLVLALIAIVYLWRLLRRGHTRFVFAACVLAVLAIPMLPSGYTARLGTIINVQADKTGSAQARLAGTRNAVNYIEHHPLIGAGIGMNQLVLNQGPDGTGKEVHDAYLVIAVELGIPGLVLFLLLLFASLREAYRAQRLASGDPLLALLAEGIWISVLAFALGAFFYPAPYEFYFYYFAGLAAAAHAIAARGSSAGADSSADRRGRAPPRAAGA